MAGTDRGIESGKANSAEAELASSAERLALTALADGETAMIVGIQGSDPILRKLEAMGMLVGARILKKSAALRQGPVVVERGGSQLALAYGIAEKIFVEPARRRGER